MAFEDITEHRRADQALKENEQLLRQVVDTSPNSVFVKDRSGKITWGGGKKTVVLGSKLDIISPIMAEWDENSSSFIYPFIFISDDNWEVDVCSRVPQGYEIAGTYDENGNLVTTDNCYQTFVSGETKVVAFDVVQTGSPPEWAMNTKIKVKGPNGRVHNLDLDVPSVVLEHARGAPFGDNPVHDQ